MANIYTDHDNKINVVIYPNQFSNDENSYYGRVTRNTVTQEQLIKGILDDNQNTNTGLNAYILNFAMDRMKTRILAELKAGNAVNVLDLGTMYLTLKGSFTVAGETPDVSAVQGKSLSVAFSPSESIQDTVSQLKIGSVSATLKGPVINSIVNLTEKKESKDFSAGNVIELKGNRLKISGSSSGVFFAPVNSQGENDSDESKWIQVPEENILKSYPKSLIFQVPAAVSPGKYVIAVRTSYCNSNTTLKSPVTGSSSKVEVLE